MTEFFDARVEFIPTTDRTQVTLDPPHYYEFILRQDVPEMVLRDHLREHYAFFKLSCRDCITVAPRDVTNVIHQLPQELFDEGLEKKLFWEENGRWWRDMRHRATHCKIQTHDLAALTEFALKIDDWGTPI